MNIDFFKAIYSHPSIKEEDYQSLMAAHTKRHVAKNELLLKEGIISNEYYLIEDGLFRAYLYDYKGKEITTSFFSQNDILIEVASLFLRKPSSEYLQALTDGVVWQIDFDVFQELFFRIEGFTEWGRNWMTNQLFQTKQRSVDMLTKSATDRYLALVSEKTDIFKHVPLKYIASYLGVTDTSLSRIRKEISDKA